MSVTDIVHDEEVYNNELGLWNETPANVETDLAQYNNSKNRFLYYPWGVFCTAFARRNLFDGILHIKEDYIYSDTDSIKMKNYKKHMDYVNKYNHDIQEKLKAALKYHGLPLDSIAPKTIKGEPKPLGVWDVETGLHGEKIYKYFKTLGAKRYIVYQKDGDGYELETTIAGLPKEKGRDFLLKISNNDINKVFQNFNNRMTVPKGQAGKLVHYYDDEKKSAVIKDYQGHYTKVTSLSSVHLEPTGFTLSLANQFIEFINLIGNNELLLKQERNVDRS